MTRRPGLVLVLALGTLGVLALLSVAFTTLAGLERRAASLRVQSARAVLMSRSALEDALARLGGGQDPDHPASRYRGEDWDASGALDGLETASETYRPGILDTSRCPAPQALRPSFFVLDPLSTGADGLAAPRRLSVEGRERGATGLLDGAYALRVARRGGFHVNGGDPAAPPSAGYNPVLRRLLGTLAEALDREDGLDDGRPVDQTDGERLIDLRPPSGWTGFELIRDLALLGDETKLEVLREHLTLDAWCDLKVIRPNAQASALGATRQCWAAILGTHAAATGGTKAPGFEVSGTRVVGRAPVDLAWARTRRPVLIALLAGLSGQHLLETGAYSDLTGAHVIGALQSAELRLDWNRATDDCRGVADQILASTSELATWQAWDAFCDTLAVSDEQDWGAEIPEEFADARQAKRDLLKANFNPNSDLNKFNPDRSLARRVDKSDLMVYSTEFNLHPRGGWTITATGRTTDTRGRLLAERTLTMDTAPDRMLRLTTQSEFVAGALGDLQRAGDESGWRAHGSAPYITASLGDGKTFGHRRFGDPGVSLQTWPEPHTVWTAPGTGTPAAYDGRLQLATLESADDEGGPDMMFLARWDDGFDADYSGGGGALGNVSPADTLQAPPSNSIWHATTVNTLYPDGIYLQKGRQPGYAALGNMHPYRGVLSFWVKPSQDASRGGFLRGGYAPQHNYINNSRHDGDPNRTAAMYFGHYGSSTTSLCTSMEPTDAFGMIVECEYKVADSTDKEHCRKTPSRAILPRRWYLLQFLWATDQTSADKGTRILVDRGQITEPRDRNLSELYNCSSSVQGPPIDYTQQVGGTAVIYLGHRGLGMGPTAADTFKRAGYPDATFDEFAIYDFGPDVEAAITSFEKLAQERFERGRYYKESAYPESGGLLTPPGPARRAATWFSAPIDLGLVHIRALAWTPVVPRGLRAPAGTLPEDGDAGPDGRVVLELAEPGVTVPALPGTAYKRDLSGAEIDTLFTNPAGQRVARQVSGAFRLHAVFQPNLSDPGNTAILDPLALDDVTLVYREPDRPLIDAWGR